MSPYYDSMIAKIIVHARDRPEAIARMKPGVSVAQAQSAAANRQESGSRRAAIDMTRLRRVAGNGLVQR